MDHNALLKKTGWNKERKINIDEYKTALIKEGYVLNDRVESFLRNFGGLYFTFPDPSLYTGVEEFNFDVIHAISQCMIDYVEYYIKEIGEELVLVGTCKRDNMSLLMSHSGKLFTAMDDIFYLLGNDSMEGLKNLIDGKIIHSYDLPLD